MKIFVTGATGFIGSHFINAALSDGHEIIALKRKNSSPRVKIKGSITWIEGVIGDPVEHYMNECEALIHFAAYGVSPQKTTWEDAFYWNVNQSIKTWKMAIKSGVKHIIISGTAAEYGLSSLDYKYIPISANLEPIGPYATSKVCSFIAAKELCRSHNVKLTYFRVFSAFGDGQYKYNLWPSLKKAALNGEDFKMTPGEQVRDFIDVKDVVKFFIDALKYDSENYDKISVKNVGSGNPQTVLNFSQYWWKYWSAKGEINVGAIPYRVDEVMRVVPEI